MRVNRLPILAAVAALFASAAQAGPRGGRAAPGSGTVVSVDAAARSFVVQPRRAQVTVTTTGDTEFLNADGSAATFADLAVGAKVVVQGPSSGENTVAATRVRIVPADGTESGAGTRLGTVVAVDEEAQSFQLTPRHAQAGSVTVTTSAETVFLNSDGAAATFADLAVGNHVAVRGAASGENTVAATEVRIGVGGAGNCQPAGGVGTVVSVDPASQSFVMAAGETQVTVTTSSNTEFLNRDGATATFADLIVGVRVAVQGVAVDDGTVDAQRVVIGATNGGSEAGSGRRRRR